MFQFIANKCLCWTLIWTRKMAKHQNLVCSDSRVKMIVLISSMFDNVKEWKPERNVLMWYMNCVHALHWIELCAFSKLCHVVDGHANHPISPSFVCYIWTILTDSSVYETADDIALYFISVGESWLIAALWQIVKKKYPYQF